MDNSINTIRRKIANAIKDLDRADYADICVLIKSNTTDTRMVNETPRGTFIDLDQIDDDIIKQLNHMISTKLQRISQR